MLKKCASGYTETLKTHHRLLIWEGKTAFLPKGEHGAKDPEIERGHIKALIRVLDLDVDCVRNHLKEIASFLKKPSQVT